MATAVEMVRMVRDAGFNVAADRKIETVYKKAIKAYNRELDLLLEDQPSKNPRLRARVVADLEGCDIERELAGIEGAINALQPKLTEVAAEQSAVAPELTA